MSWFSSKVFPVVGKLTRETYRPALKLSDSLTGREDEATAMKAVNTHYGIPEKKATVTAPVVSAKLPNYASPEILANVARKRKLAANQFGNAATNRTGGLSGNPTLGRSLLFPVG